MSIEDFLAVTSESDPKASRLMLRAALSCAVSRMTYQMKFLHEKELQQIVELSHVATADGRDVS